MTGIAFLIAVIAAVLAAMFWFQAQSAGSAVKGLKAAADDAHREAEVARAEQKKLDAEVKARGLQLVETREKLNELRKKSQEGKPKAQQPRGAREAELEEDLAHARKLTEEAHAAEAAARRELAAVRSAEAQARSELAAAQARVREMAARPAVPVAAPVPETDGAQTQLMNEIEKQRKQLEAARTELDRQVQQAERNAREAKRRESELRDEVRKMRGRAETNNRVYLVTKGELEVTKERLAQAERKLWQAGIPLAPPPSKDRPKATGPAAADRPREEGGTAGGAESLAEGSGAEVSAPSGEPISAGEASIPGEDPSTLTPTGVAPIRRRPAEEAADKPQS
jgi:Skp family chaperone for outer membrane proteins